MHDVPLGSAATLHVGQDCYPATVVSQDCRTITIQRDRVIRARTNTRTNECFGILYSINPNGDRFDLYKKQDGTWCVCGYPGLLVTIGSRRLYRDAFY